MKPAVYFLLVVIQSDMLLTLYVPQEYVVPEPKFEVFSPRGFSVSIRDEEGLTLFAFHGNVNNPMNGLEVGQLSKDVMTKRNSRWVFEDKKTKLSEGDVIYFWILVIKNNLGYRYDDGQFIVKDVVQNQNFNRPQPSSGQPTTEVYSRDETRTPKFTSVCDIALNLSKNVDQLNGDVKKLLEINDVLKQIVAKDDSSSRTLRFEGILPPFDDAQYTAQIIVREKLGLNIPVISARRESDKSITFDVVSLDDKIHVIRAAKEKLEKTKSKIILRY